MLCMSKASNFTSSQSSASYKPVEEKLKGEIINSLKSRIIPVKLYVDSRIIESSILEIVGNKFILNYTPTQTGIYINKDILCECHFSLGRDMFFFKTQLESENENLAFQTPGVVYKVQRRENFRVYLPSTLLQSVEIVGDRSAKVTLNNISLTGGQIVIKSNQQNLALDRFKLNDPLKLKLTLLDFNHQIINCVIKFVEVSPKDGSTVCGIQFQNLDFEKTQELQSIITKIDRLNRAAA